MRHALAASQDCLALSLNAFAALLISPVSWSHHWVWCAPGLLTLADLGRRHRRRLAVAAAACGLVLFAAAPQWWLGEFAGPELRWAAWQQAIGSSYVFFAALVLLLSACGRLPRQPRQPALPPIPVTDLLIQSVSNGETAIQRACLRRIAFSLAADGHEADRLSMLFCAQTRPFSRSAPYGAGLPLADLAGDEALMRSTFTLAYHSVLSSWKSFLAHDDGKPIILIGDHRARPSSSASSRPSSATSRPSCACWSSRSSPRTTSRCRRGRSSARPSRRSRSVTAPPRPGARSRSRLTPHSLIQTASDF